MGYNTVMYEKKSKFGGSGVRGGGFGERLPKIAIAWFFVAFFCVCLFILNSCSEGDKLFRGKTVTVVVPYGAGGMDDYARALAPFFQKHLYGSRVVVRNMPGEGGIVGKNYVYSAKADGLTLCFATSAASLLAEWAGLPDLHFKTSSFSFLGRIDADDHLLVVSAKSRYASFAEILREGRIEMGFSGQGSDVYFVALLTADLLGLALDARTDFASSNDLTLACVKGEINGSLLSTSNFLPLIEAGTVRPMVVFNTARLAALPSTPTIFEFMPPSQKEVMESLIALYSLDRTLFGPPGIDPERLGILRRALDRAAADPEFLSNMERLGRPVDYLSGEGTLTLLARILKEEGTLKRLVSKDGKAFL